MMLKKVNSQAIIEGDIEEISVMIEPKKGHSDDEVIDSLNHVGAVEVEVIAPGFISAQVKRRVIAKLSNIAEVHPKALKQTRNKYKVSW